MALWQWSKVATNNGTADPTISAQEGIPPSIVDDDIRALMARVAEYRDDTSGLLVTGGTSTAYTLTTNQGLPTTPNDGQLIVFSPHVTNGASATLAADGGTAFPLQSSPGTALPSGSFTANIPFQFKFRAASSAWILFGAGNVATANVALAVAAGSVTNAGLANMAAWTLKGNNSGSPAAPGDFTIDALTAKASPLAADEVPIWDAAGAAMKKATLTTLAAAVASGNTAPTVQTFLSGSSITYTPAAGIKRIKVRMCGGGGGAGASISGNGGAGGNTSFGGWAANGGAGGLAAAGGTTAGGSGGGTGTGTLVSRFTGGSGGGGNPQSGAGANYGGNGGNNPFGGAGQAGGTSSAGSSGAANTGSGGGGGGYTFGSDGRAGGGGGAGEYVEFWMTAAQVGASQTYTVGTGGTGGSASGNAGGNGAAGIIIIEEFYI